MSPTSSDFGSTSPKPSSSFTCPRCGKDAFHVVTDLNVRVSGPSGWQFPAFDDREKAFEVTGDHLRVLPVPNGDPLDWFASVCVACSQGCVWRGDQLIYPQVSQVAEPHPEMPEAARELYNEAALVLPVSRRAAAALARAALERLLRALPGAEAGARLDELIAALAPQVSHKLWQTLTALRYLGNDTLHNETKSELVALYLDGDAAAVVEPIFGAINLIFEEVIVQPRIADDLYAMLPEGVRATAERKRDA